MKKQHHQIPSVNHIEDVSIYEIVSLSSEKEKITIEGDILIDGEMKRVRKTIEIWKGPAVNS